MRYAISLVFFLLSFFLSISPVLAIDECQADVALTPIVLDQLPKDPQQCPPQATCYKKSPQLGATSYNCFFATTEPKACTECSNSKGQQCNTSTGSIVTDGGNGILTAVGCIPTQPKEMVQGILKFTSFAGGGIALILMILAALQMITAEGNPESIKTAQERFYSAIIGLLLIIFSVLLMQVIGVDILGLSGMYT